MRGGLVPLDPNIILGGQQPQIPNLGQTLAQALQIRSLMEQRDALAEERRAKTAEQQQKTQQEQQAAQLKTQTTGAINDAWQADEHGHYTINRDVAIAGLKKIPGVDVSAVLQHLDAGEEATSKATKARADAQKAQAELSKAANDAAGSYANGVKAAGYTPAAWAMAVKTMHLNGLLDDQQFNDHLALTTQGPQAIKAATDAYIARSDEQRKLAADEAAKTEAIKAREAQIAHENNVAAETARHNQAMEKTAAQRAATEAQKAAQAGGGAAVTLTPQQERLASDLATGIVSFSDFNKIYGSRSGAGSAVKAAIYDKARTQNPDFNPTAFEAGQRMFSNPQIRQRMTAIDQLSPVIDKITTLAKANGNTDLPALNRLINGAKFQLGGTTATDLRQLQTLLGDEVGNALGVGTGSDLKTRLGIDLVNTNLGPKQFAETMQQLKDVLGSRRKALADMMGPYGKNTEPKAAPADPLGIR